MAIHDILIDKRILQRNLDKGVVDSKQFEKHLASLPDRSENAAHTTVEVEPTEAGESETGAEGGGES